MRHDFEAIEAEKAQAVMAHLNNNLDKLSGQQFDNFTLTEASNFSYQDPIDNSVSSNQGIIRSCCAIQGVNQCGSINILVGAEGADQVGEIRQRHRG